MTYWVVSIYALFVGGLVVHLGVRGLCQNQDNGERSTTTLDFVIIAILVFISKCAYSEYLLKRKIYAISVKYLLNNKKVSDYLGYAYDMSSFETENSNS